MFIPSAKPLVALIGAANLDIAAHSHAPLLMGDSNPGRILCSPGGVARNVAENLLRLGLEARLISVLGDDAFAQVLRQHAATIGLDLSACQSLAGQRTATYMSLHGVDGDMGVAVNDMGILEQLTPALVVPHLALLQAAQAWVLDSNLRADTLAWLCDPLRWRGVDKAPAPVFAEAVSVAKCHKLLPHLGQLQLLKANRLEAQSLSGLDIHTPQDAMAAARALQQRGARQVVVSLGAAGAVWCDAGGRTGQQAARPVQVASATGAGDAMLAGLVHGYVQGLPLAESVDWAMACAELCLSSTFANSPDLGVAAVRARLSSPHL